MMFDENSAARSFYWTGAAISFGLAVWLFTYNLAQRRTKNRVTLRQAFKSELATVDNLASIKTALLGLAGVLAITPVGYYLSRDFEKALDSLAFAAPCLAGIIVGLAVLDSRPKAPQSGMNVTPLVFSVNVVNLGDIATQEEQVAVPAQLTPSAVGNAVKKKRSRNAERTYYLASTVFLFFAFIGYIGSHFNNAIIVFLILFFAWFCLFWALTICWKREKAAAAKKPGSGNDESTNSFGAIILSAILGILLVLLTYSAASRWDNLRGYELDCACNKQAAKNG